MLVKSIFVEVNVRGWSRVGVRPVRQTQGWSVFAAARQAGSLQRRSSVYWIPCILFEVGMPFASGGSDREGSSIGGAGGG